MTTAVATREANMKRILMGESLRAEIEMAIPRHLPVERFQRVLMTSVVHDDRLAGADPMKIVKAALKVAPLGLLTDPLLGEAYLILDGRGEVQVRIGYRGLIKLARQSDQIAAIYAHEVYENDEIDCTLGDHKRLYHKPNLFGDRGSVVGYYAVVKYTGGETDFEPMTVTQIDSIKARSDGWRAFKAGKIKDTPWHSSYDEMAKKTALRRLLKRVPTSSDLADALRHESALDNREYGQEMQDITPSGPTAAKRRAAMAAVESVEIVDEDGEIHYVLPGEIKQFLRDHPGARRADEVVETTSMPADPPAPAGAPAAAGGNGNGGGTSQPMTVTVVLLDGSEISGPPADVMPKLQAEFERLTSDESYFQLCDANAGVIRRNTKARAWVDAASLRLGIPFDDSGDLDAGQGDLGLAR